MQNAGQEVAGIGSKNAGNAKTHPSALYFWAAILIVRASATNIIGDLFHDYKVGFAASVPLMVVLLIAAVGVGDSDRVDGSELARKSPGQNLQPRS